MSLTIETEFEQPVVGLPTPELPYPVIFQRLVVLGALSWMCVWFPQASLVDEHHA